MAAIGTALIGKVLGHTEAEKAFRPWWDTLEDNLIYVLIMVGLMVAPTAIIMGTPLDCNFCQDDHCSPYNNTSPDPKFNAWWVKKYCTMNGSVEPFMLYFPYFLLFIALILWMVERVFLKIFQAGLKLETFYSFLVSENILSKGSQKDPAVVIDVTDGGREALELKQSFKGNSNYFVSYIVRTTLEILIAMLLLAFICIYGLPVIEHQDTIYCDVHNYWFECSGQPAQFYVYVLYITFVITGMYMLLNVYNFLWLTFPCFGKLSRLMQTYKGMIMESAKEGQSTAEAMGELWEIYYNNRDLRLLLDLLATSSGVAPAISIMTLFDKKFGKAMQPKILQIAISKDLGLARVEFQEPKTGVRSALSRLPGVHLLYVAEISPPADTSVEGFEFKPCDQTVDEDGDICLTSPSLTENIQAAVFTGLKQDIQYTIKVSTIVNGQTISQVTEQTTIEHERLPEDIKEQVAKDKQAQDETKSLDGTGDH